VVPGCGSGTVGGFLGTDHLAMDIACANPLTSMDDGSQKRAETINGAAFLRIDADILRP
jgi:hypothetical protein